MRYPARLLTEDEHVLRQFPPHWRVLLLPIAGTGAAIAALVAIWSLADGRVAWVLTAVTGIAWALATVPPVVRWYVTRYVLTNERIVVRSGLVSRSSIEIPLENINHVRFTQGVMERLLGYGDVLIESASEQGQSRLHDIPDPEEFQSEVYRAREERSLHFRGDPGPRDAVAQLEALASLHERGVLTDEEFAEKRQRLLDQI